MLEHALVDLETGLPGHFEHVDGVLAALAGHGLHGFAEAAESRVRFAHGDSEAVVLTSLHTDLHWGLHCTLGPPE